MGWPPRACWSLLLWSFGDIGRCWILGWNLAVKIRSMDNYLDGPRSSHLMAFHPTRHGCDRGELGLPRA